MASTELARIDPLLGYVFQAMQPNMRKLVTPEQLEHVAEKIVEGRALRTAITGKGSPFPDLLAAQSNPKTCWKVYRTQGMFRSLMRTPEWSAYIIAVREGLRPRLEDWVMARTEKAQETFEDILGDSEAEDAVKFRVAKDILDRQKNYDLENKGVKSGERSDEDEIIDADARVTELLESEEVRDAEFTAADDPPEDSSVAEDQPGAGKAR